MYQTSPTCADLAPGTPYKCVENCVLHRVGSGMGHAADNTVPDAGHVDCVALAHTSSSVLPPVLQRH